MSSDNTMEITLVMNNKGAITGIKDFTGKLIEIPDVAKKVEEAMKKSTEKMKGCLSLMLMLLLLKVKETWQPSCFEILV